MNKEVFIILLVVGLIAHVLAFSLYAFYGYAFFDVSMIVDGDAPQLVLISPEAKEYSGGVVLRYFVSDPFLDSVWYVLEGEKRMVNGSTTLSLEPGKYELVLYANDSSGRMNSTRVNFTIVSSSGNFGSGGGGAGGGGVGGEIARNGSLEKVNQTKLDLRSIDIDLQIIGQDAVRNFITTRLIIDSSSSEDIEVTYTLIGDKILYQDIIDTGYRKIIEHQIPFDMRLLAAGSYIISARARQAGLAAHDEEVMIVERVEMEYASLQNFSWGFVLLILALLLEVIALWMFLKKKER